MGAVITLCNSTHCERSATCSRHEDSGAKAGHRQAISDYSFQRWWEAKHCFGFLPLESVPVQPGRRPIVRE